jgi:hypothetical protein
MLAFFDNQTVSVRWYERVSGDDNKGLYKVAIRHNEDLNFSKKTTITGCVKYIKQPTS